MINKIIHLIPNLIFYIKTLFILWFNNDNRFIIPLAQLRPHITDRTSNTPFDRHYIYHTGWAARVLMNSKPKIHYDFSSSLYFISIVSAFQKIKFFDFRPAKLELSNLDSESADLCALDFPDNSIESLSCMHVIEHIGLGRYGDPLDVRGDLKAMAELIRVTKIGGSILFVVPIGGKSKIIFNAHRIYTFEQIREYFKNFDLIDFYFITDQDFIPHAVHFPTNALLSNQDYGCGCFHFIKKDY